MPKNIKPDAVAASNQMLARNQFLSLSTTDKKLFISEAYNEAKLNNEKLVDGTTEFFKAIQPIEKKTFDSSTRQIIQFGVSVGKYIGPLCKPSRPVVGYDQSTIAIEVVKQYGISGRQINLNEVLEGVNGKELPYHSLLAKDLSIPADILVIRLLEYLDLEAINLLMIAVINLMQPGSQFYLEIMSGKEVAVEFPGAGALSRNIEPGYIPSFFGPRTDIKFVSRELTYNEKNDIGSGDTTVERFIAMKL